MRYLIAIILLITFPVPTYGQQYAIEEIGNRGDSLLKAALGNLYDYAHLDSGSYYGYKRKGKLSYQYLFEKAHHKNSQFTGATLIYQLTMPYPDCKLADTVKGTIYIALDTLLLSTTPPDVSFIPPFVLNNEKCSFINRDSAITIAMNDHIKLGVTKPYAFIRYKPEEKRFVWIVKSTLWDDMDFNNENHTKQDTVEIDATNGTVAIHKIVPYTTGD